MTHKRDPVLSNEECFQIAGKWGEPINEPEYCGGPIYYCVKEVSNLYEDRLAKDAELIQKLVDALEFERKSIISCRESSEALDAAAAAGFTPTDQ